MRKAERAVLVGIVVAIAIALRWAFVATGQVPQPLRADAGEYAQCALNLVDHGVYSSSKQAPPPPDSFRSPGYPVFLALCRLAAGPERWLGLAVALQVALGGLAVLLTYWLARSWLTFPAALSACVLAALSPHLVVSSGYVLTECVTTFVLVAGLSLLSAASTRGPLALAAAGLGLGFGVLCNETLLFVPLVAAFALWHSLGRGGAVLLISCALLPFAAWTVRNQTQTLARTGAERVTASISHGSYPGMVFRDPKLKGFPYREDPEQPAFGASWANLRGVLGPRIAAEPWRYAAWYLLEKPLWLWRWDHVQGNGPTVYEVVDDPYDRPTVIAATGWLMRWLHVPVMLAAAGAAVWFALRARRAPGIAGVLGLVAVFGTLAYVPVIPDPRYLQPFRPVLFVLAGAALSAISGLIQRAVGRRRSVNSAAENGGQTFLLGLPTSSRTAPPSS